MTTHEIIKELRARVAEVLEIEDAVDEDGYTDEEADSLQANAIEMASLFNALDLQLKIDEAPTKE